MEFLSRARVDIILLQEADLNARRTRYLNIAREISQ
jgi:endonuclease/exonuclease/phosphatase family metal-dependent hydrolase